MSFNKDVIAGNLRAERGRLNLSREKLAEEIGIPASTLGEYEQGRSAPSIENFWKLADRFSISLDELAGRTALAKEN